MATFGKATSNASKYATGRPTYPRVLYDFVFKFHEHAKGARWDAAVDIGCGQATAELTPFQRIISADASARMIEQARESVKTRLAGLDLSSRVGQVSAEALPVGRRSVDLIVAAQACHWFNKGWPEVARALRKDGTFAAWGYSGFRLSGFPSVTPLINDYGQGSDPVNSLGPYWERPGSTILDGHLVAVPDPRDALPGDFNEFERIYFTGSHYPDLPGARPVILHKALTWTELLGFLRTWSPLHTFHEAHPGDLERADGDIAVRFWRRLKEEVARVKGKSKVPKDEDVVDIEWPMVLLLARQA